MKKTVLAAAALVVAVFWSAPAPAEIKIGLMTPLTGAFASEGQDMLKVCEILTGEVNKAGGINGQKVTLVVEDDGGDPRTAALAAQKLLNILQGRVEHSTVLPWEMPPECAKDVGK